MPGQLETGLSSRAVTIVLAGGGTGGHLFPALAVAEALNRLRPDVRLMFAGTKGRIEERVVPSYGYPFVSIWISGFQRGALVSNLLLPLKILVSLVQSLYLMLRQKPAVVVGTGGYVCGPVLFASSLLGIPTVLHESNSYPGITTRMLAGRVTKVFLGFEDARRWLPRTHAVTTVGTPTRASIGVATRPEGIGTFRLDPDRPVVLVLGGSQGAATINEAIFALLEDLDREGAQLIWQTGERNFDSVMHRVGERRVGWIGPFVAEMDRAYAAADLVICRAGATTIAELTCAAKPAVLIPYPHAAGNHQTRNAESMARAGAATIVAERELARLNAVVLDLLRSPSKRAAMGRAGATLAQPHAAELIAKEVLDLATQQSVRGHRSTGAG
ncbi:MAG: undecaprenyldiphospho-muramoylpentapeptide beta-N-acetylglucosaminyltransferase [Ignavibacteriales bacterium]|nr:undecaprenyldiphospho-muramoylpentapeptide beta-N-acetylglucosaminyltransferase [Ignavibacteriales bacterium]